jgi:hypothetical protein
MGRPLKIAKAQAVITITATTATTNIVTTSANLTNLGIIAGMPFIPATTVGGLVGGTTYYVLQVLSATTFLASATQLSANPTYTPVTLTTTTGQTVAATVGLVNSGFNNPAGAANTYGVVGGNTTLFGNQVLANVAIGVNGTGTLYAYDDSAFVGGIGTDLGNIAVGSIIQYVDSDGSLVTLGNVDDNIGTITVEIEETASDGNITVDDASNLVAGLPITLEGNIGGLVEGVSYLISNIDTGNDIITVTNLNGSAVTLANANVAVDAFQNLLELDANASANVAGVEFVFATPEPGYIVRQKGKTKYLVTGSTTGLTAQCFTANVANAAMTPNTCVILGTTAAAASVNIRSLNNYSSEVFYDTSNADANPDVFSTFNSAEAANVAAGILNPVVTINKA